MSAYKIITAATAAGLLFLTACSGTSSLAKNIEGSWSGTPKSLSTDIAGSTTIVEIISFLPGDIKNGGNFEVTAMISATGSARGMDGSLLPYDLTASASAAAKGSWRAIDDDEIAINIDPSTIDVSVDQDAQVFNNNMITDAEKAALDSIRPNVMNLLEHRIKRDVMTRFMSVKHLDDVKVKSDLLKYEIDDDHYTLSRQP